jgi:hypothetical protein
MAEVTVTVPAGGAGRILVSDGFDGTYTGGYHLYIQRLNEPGNAAPLALGTTEAAAVSLSAHMQTRSLTGAAGDVLVFRMANREENRSVTIWPLIRVYGPAGNLVAEVDRPTTADLTGTLPIAGAYTLLLGDAFDGTYTGAFGIFAQRVNDPVNAAPLDFARGPSGAIEAPGVVKTYTVALPDGYDSPLHLRMRRTGGDLWPRLRLYGPDGALLAEQKDTRAADISLAVPAARTYTILADDGFNGTLAGFYTIGWHYAFSDAARALRLAAGATPSSPAERARFDILASGALDITDAAWILRNATGLQYLP